MNKDRHHYGFTVGQTVYMYNSIESQLLTAEKFNVIFIGPLQFINV